MSAPAHWLEAEELPRCQHCPSLADERSFMCEGCAFQADTEVQNLRDQVEAATEAMRRIAQQGLGTWDKERRCMMGDTGEPWEHWATIAQRWLDANGQRST